jgi:hypothetical protein
MSQPTTALAAVRTATTGTAACAAPVRAVAANYDNVRNFLRRQGFTVSVTRRARGRWHATTGVQVKHRRHLGFVEVDYLDAAWAQPSDEEVHAILDRVRACLEQRWTVKDDTLGRLVVTDRTSG